MSEALDNEIRTLRAQFWSARDPEGRAFVPLADAYRRKGELNEAAALVEDGLARLPDFTPGHLVAARIHRAKGDLEGARTALDRVLDMDGENILALLERAELARDTGDHEQAVKGLRALLSLDPSHVGARAALDGLEFTGGGAAGPASVEESAAFEPVDGVIEPAELDPADGAIEPAIESAELEPMGGADPALERTGEADAGLEGAEPDAPFTAEELLDPDDLFLGEGQSDEGGAPDETPDEHASSAPGSATSTGDLDVFDFEFLVEEDARDRAEEPDIVRDELGGGDPEVAGLGGDVLDRLDLDEPDQQDTGFDDADLELPDEGIDPEEPYVDFARTEPVDEGQEPLDARLEAADEPSDPVDAEPEAVAEDPEPADEERAPLVTRTMAEIFVRQGLLDRAGEIYERLIVESPDRTELRERLDEILAMRREEAEEKAAYSVASGQGPGGHGSDRTLILDDEDPSAAAPQWAAEEKGREGDADMQTPFAWSESDHDEARTATGTETRTIRDHFADLLSWVPGAVPIADLAPGAAPGASPESAVPIETLAPDPAPATAVPGEELVSDPPEAAAIPIQERAPGPPPEPAPAGSRAAARDSDPGAEASDGRDAADEDLEGFEAWLKSFGR